MTEEDYLQTEVVAYIKEKYPDIMVSKSASGIPLTKHQALMLSRQQIPSEGWNDVFIAQPRFDVVFDDDGGFHESWTHGLFIELKIQGYKLYKKDGELRANSHTKQQVKVHEMLNARGYLAVFACGYKEAIEIIDIYLEKNKL